MKSTSRISLSRISDLKTPKLKIGISIPLFSLTFCMIILKSAVFLRVYWKDSSLSTLNLIPTLLFLSQLCSFVPNRTKLAPVSIELVPNRMKLVPVSTNKSLKKLLAVEVFLQSNSKMRFLSWKQRFSKGGFRRTQPLACNCYNPYE